MIPLSLRREFPAPSFSVFFALQALDVLTTLIGLQMGASESSIFIGRLLRWGPVTGLLIAKVFAVLLALAAYRFKRARAIVFLNFWFSGIVTWNLVAIVSTLLRR